MPSCVQLSGKGPGFCEPRALRGRLGSCPPACGLLLYLAEPPTQRPRRRVCLAHRAPTTPPGSGRCGARRSGIKGEPAGRRTAAELSATPAWSRPPRPPPPPPRPTAPATARPTAPAANNAMNVVCTRSPPDLLHAWPYQDSGFNQARVAPRHGASARSTTGRRAFFEIDLLHTQRQAHLGAVTRQRTGVEDHASPPARKSA